MTPAVAGRRATTTGSSSSSSTTCWCVAFDRPEARNAFDSAMYRAVAGALSGALGDDDVHAVVLTGRGKAFTSGQDLREMAAIATGEAGPDAGTGFQDLLDVLHALRQAAAGRRARRGHGARAARSSATSTWC